MGCSNSTQVVKGPDADQTTVKSLNSFQISAPPTNSTLDSHSETLETTAQTRLPLANTPSSISDSDSDLGFDVFDEVLEEEKEFDVAMMELSNDLFMGQNSQPPVAPVAPAVVIKTCSICAESVSNDRFLLSPCKVCPNLFCNNCLRKMFISACGDESQMPPRCCGPLNFGAGVSVLSAEELELFKNKHEEWATASRVYCPIPTCSAFIPYRLFPFDYRPTSTTLAKPKVNEAPPVVLLPTHPMAPPPTTLTSDSPPPPESATVQCPGCSIEICCTCKQVAHKGTACPEGAGELDPDLAVLLEKWKVKRCPKCRGAVRLMFGCNHVACRCGSQWCWYCMQPIEICRDYGCTYEGSVDQEEGEEEDEFDGEDVDNENHSATGDRERCNQAPHEVLDLDRGGESRWNTGTYQFNLEPDVDIHDPIDCDHRWIEAATHDVEKSQKYVCERCWNDILPKPRTNPKVVELVEDGLIPEKSITDSGKKVTLGLKLLNCHYCAIMLCDDCREVDTANKVARSGEMA
ncbi:hypothetical protein ACJ72_01055 [Emergomyces africanus]|uniref:RING-type domain-containing protein n=1 Tax=Emergomyces africanus TaxID=1955775 RepID=A0A1B7P6P4_9EURO|nr:hypothetical protein ACJ72_01055 [Emergomyces africanus]